jgi:HEAT repeat protein
MLFAVGASAIAREAEWIWSPAYEKELAPGGTCYFRKTFQLGAPEHGVVQIACDDKYELFVNGRPVGDGKNWKVLDNYDITKFLVQGQNTVAVKAVNTEQGSAGLVARVAVKQVGNTHVEYSTDASWKTTLKEFPQWQKTRFADGQWLAARSFGALGATLPWGNEVSVAGADGRFKVTPEFHVEWVIDPKETGSLVCMAFDEFGQILAARENGPLLVIRDDDKDGLVDTVATHCDTIKNCQGILPISGKIFVVAEGPQGAGLYRLGDEDHDGKIDQVDVILKFKGEMGEHGPHALALGPDGLVYMMAGNFSQITDKFADASPYRHYAEGDLITPRYEDASGHAVGIKAPGGAIVRTDTAGSAVELFAGGMQNPYDLVFNAEGDLFTCDSDMEWDSGMTWYRPTRLLHVGAGAEFGWRSGWAKWPNYFADSLPPTMELGRGSPAGLEFYNHVMFPRRYHNTMFMCDWSRGRILCIRPKAHGATYRATAEVFVEGQPLNVTDIAVGPDGWLYFCTGGRETEGGIYRVVWQGKVPPEVTNRGEGIDAALNQQQLSSAWARQQVALVMQQLGDQWAPQVNAVVTDAKAPPHHRARALELLQLYGPTPSTPLLVQASRDTSPQVRIRAARLLGIHADEAAQKRLIEMLADKDMSVERAACEAIVRGAVVVPADKLLPLLNSPDRYVSWAAGRALQQIPADQWADVVLHETQARAFVNGAVALLGPEVDRATIDGLLDHSAKLMKSYLTDEEFIHLLRVTQLALLKGGIKGDEVPQLRAQLSDEYPSRDLHMNRELVRLLVYLQEPTLAERIVEQLRGDLPSVEKMHLLVHVRFLEQGRRTRGARRQELCRLRGKHLARLLCHLERRRAPDGPGRRREVAHLGPERAGQAARETQRPDALPDSRPGPPGAKTRHRGRQASARRHLRGAGRQRGSAGDEIPPRAVRRRARSPRGDCHGPRPAGRRGQLALPGPRIVDRRRRRGSGSLDAAGPGRPAAGRTGSLSPGHHARPDAARQWQPAGRRAAREVDRPESRRRGRLVERHAGGLATMVCRKVSRCAGGQTSPGKRTQSVDRAGADELPDRPAGDACRGGPRRGPV